MGNLTVGFRRTVVWLITGQACEARVVHEVHDGKDGAHATGELVVIHDPTLDRTTTGSGPVAARTAGELRGLRLKKRDGTLADGGVPMLEELSALDPHLKVVRLRRNFGQTAALQAGIDWSSGEVLITMDGDLQNDPADIPVLLDKLAEGYDAVLGMRANRQDHWLVRKIPSLLGNWLIRLVTGVHIKDMGCTLRAMRRDLAEALPLYGELHRFVPVLAQQYGGRLAQVPVRHHARAAGKTKYN